MAKSWRRATWRFHPFDAAPAVHSAVFEHMADGAIVVDDRGCVVDLNPAAARMVDRPASAVAGRPVVQVLPAWPGWVERAADPSVGPGEIVLGEGTGRRYLELRLTPLYDARGRPNGWLALLHDVTAHKQAEAELRRQALVFEHLPDTAILVDEQGRIVDCNPVAEQRLGRPRQELLGQPLETWDASLAAASDTALEGEEGCWSGEVGEDGCLSTRARRGDGARGASDVTVAPLRDEGGQPVARLIVGHDTTVHQRAEASLRAQMQLYEGLVAVARATAEQPTLEATLQNALDVMATLTRAEYGSLFLLDETGAVTPSFVALGGTRTPEQQEGASLAMEKGLAGWVVRHRQVALVDDTAADGRWLQLASSHTTGSALAVPIASGQALLGVLTLTHPATGHFDAEHARLVQAAGDQMALALRNAQNFDAQRRMAERQATLYKVLTTIGWHLDLQSLARTTVETITWLTDWPVVAVLLPDDTRTCLEIRAVQGPPFFGEGWTQLIEQSVVGRAFQSAQTQYVPDVSADDRYADAQSGKRPEAGCELALPLRHGEQVLGVLALQSDQSQAFNDDDVLLAESLAEAVALALTNAQLYAETRQHVADLTTLYTITRVVGQSLALEDILYRALLSVIISLEFDAGLIALVDPDDHQLHIWTEHGLPSILSRRLHQDGLEGTVCDYVQERRGSLVVSGHETEMNPAFKDMVARTSIPELRACIAIPLVHQDESLGVLCLYVRRPRRLNTNEMILLETIGRHVGAAVTSTRLFKATVNERQRLLTLLESSRDGIVFISVDQRIRVVNASGLACLGLAGQPDEWTDRPLEEVLLSLRRRAPAVLEVVSAEMRRIHTGDEPPGEGEYKMPPRTIHWLSLPVVADATPLGRLLVLHDVTEERMLEKMREDLTHTMVHDLRNPLTSLSMALELLNKPEAGSISAQQRVMLDYARGSLRRMLVLVNNILDVNRLEEGRMPLERTSILLTDLVAETVRQQSLLAEQKAIRLESDVPLTLPTVWADAGLIERVLQNLIGNAIKFTPIDGRVKVSVELARAEKKGPNKQVRVSISDTGPGIPSELQERLFQKFVAGRHAESGSGLGLAFCKLAVEAHKGRIWVESEPERGATFAFTLPVTA